ncbi:MAG: VacJ family lipoprotein [Alphaproteobacteria bacterium]|jgi:phospholipid-binding lipoprotein MlaA|nr:VacJ family lipoprotein [Alphaproteobacteria bacterium]
MWAFLRLPAALLSIALATAASSQGTAQVGTGAMTDRFRGLTVDRRAQDVSARLAGNPRLQAALRRQSRERIVTTLSALAIAIIAEAPGRRREVIDAAMAAAPSLAGEIHQRIAAAYPEAQGGYGAAAPVGQSDLVAGRPRRPQSEYAAALEAWLVGSIARDPAHLEAWVDQAVAAAPEQRWDLVAAASHAFPGHASRIAAAAHAAPGDRTAAPSAWPAVAATEPPPEPTPRQAAAVEAIWDPLEPLNRTVHSVNDMVDTVVLRPIAWTYNTITPDPVIHAMRRFFENLRAPVIVANDVLQLSFGDAAVALGRFGVNSTLGILGFFDPATGLGLEAHHADFGQTLHHYGAGPGPYIVLPLVGPSTTRDGIGLLVDIFFQPLSYFLTTEQSLAVLGVKTLVVREELLEPLDELRAGSVDYYSALQSAYYQRRAIELGKGVASASVMAPQEEVDRLFDEAE